MALEQGITPQQVNLNFSAFENIFKICGFTSLVTRSSGACLCQEREREREREREIMRQALLYAMSALTLLTASEPFGR